jgi:hypothetical protein
MEGMAGSTGEQHFGVLTGVIRPYSRKRRHFEGAYNSGGSRDGFSFSLFLKGFSDCTSVLRVQLYGFVLYE